MTFRSEAESDLLSQLLAHGDPHIVIWDFDGVVAHSEPLHERSYSVLAQRRDHVLSDGYFDELVGHTEPWIWQRLIERGFPGGVEQIDELTNERGAEFRRTALNTLQPTWLASRLAPEFSARGIRQVIVSNGNTRLIETLLNGWNLDGHFEVAHRAPGQDKRRIFTELCVPPALVLEDSPEYLGLARRLGAVTVGVQHSHNRHASIEADHLAEL